MLRSRRLVRVSERTAVFGWMRGKGTRFMDWYEEKGRTHKKQYIPHWTAQGGVIGRTPEQKAKFIAMKKNAQSTNSHIGLIRNFHAR